MVLTTQTYDYYECERCKINTETKGRMCPCPRGSCDAELKGKVMITKSIFFNNPPNNRNDIDDIGQIMASINA